MFICRRRIRQSDEIYRKQSCIAVVAVRCLSVTNLRWPLSTPYVTNIYFTDKCSFEDLTSCGFTQMTRDDFDWTSQSMSTGSRGTGPSFDHTYGTRAGNVVNTLQKKSINLEKGLAFCCMA